MRLRARRRTTKRGGGARLALALAVLLAGCATSPPRGGLLSGHGQGLVLAEATGGSGGPTEPPGWPDFASGDAEALLAPFLGCAAPSDFLSLQQRVDMPRLVEALDDWRAVRLGAQGPVREEASSLLNHKRTAFLVAAPERYGTVRAQVLSLFIVHTAHDDDLREILFLLARDKRLAELLQLLPTFQTALEKRGLKPTARVDRDFEWRDLGRGLARAGADALSSSPMSDGGGGFAFFLLREQLPPDYQRALDEAERKWMEHHFSAGNVVLGGVDHLTFGVPLGFYGLLASTGQGASSLARGEYERATRELAPAVLLVALYAGGKGLRAFSEARGAPGLALEPRWRGLQETARRLEAVLDMKGLLELARYLQASREAGRFVAAGGVDAALALHEARGDVARARPLMARARAEAVGAARPTGSLASLVDKERGLTHEVVEAKLAAMELESTGPRLPRDVRVLEKRRPALDAPPPEAQGNPRWGEYVGYYEKRLGEVKEGRADRGPLPWEAYERMRGGFARGLAFERVMVALLEADARLPRAQRRFLGDFDQPRIETNVGVMKPGPGLRFADVLVIEEGGLGGQPRRVETFSFKSRDLSKLDETITTAQMIADASEALRHYGETLNVRRDSLQPLLREGSEVHVQRVRLIYEGGEFKPKGIDDLDVVVNKVQAEVPGVEVFFQ